MNYKIIFQDTLRLFRESKLLWITGFFYVVIDIVERISEHAIWIHPTSWILYPLFLITLYFSFLAQAALIYSTHQLFSQQNPTFSETWSFCKTKIKRILELFFVSFPFAVLIVLLPEIVKLTQVSAALTSLVAILIIFFLTSFFILSICTIVISNLESELALRTGFLMVFHNFFHLIILNGIFLVLATFLNALIRMAVFQSLLAVPLTVTMTLAYQTFIVKNSYPALSNIQPNA